MSNYTEQKVNLEPTCQVCQSSVVFGNPDPPHHPVSCNYHFRKRVNTPWTVAEYEFQWLMGCCQQREMVSFQPIPQTLHTNPSFLSVTRGQRSHNDLLNKGSPQCMWRETGGSSQRSRNNTRNPQFCAMSRWMQRWWRCAIPHTRCPL